MQGHFDDQAQKELEYPGRTTWSMEWIQAKTLMNAAHRTYKNPLLMSSNIEKNVGEANQMP